jgi:hypothetical protein
VTFHEYLISKKIDPITFSQSDPDRFADWEKQFALLHPNSFTVQKFYLINPIRRKYPLAASDHNKKSEDQAAPKQVKPVIKPRPKF